MAATLPGRTHGLGLITTRLLADFSAIDPTSFAHINLVATLVGSLFCLPCGWLVDRFGTRPVLGVVMLSLAATVFAMSLVTDLWILGLTVTLTRGIGQSMLSVVSITMLGKWFRKDAGPAMGGYAVLMTLLMAVGTGLLASRISAVGWRPAWQELAILLAALTPLAWLLAVPPAHKPIDLENAEGNENGSQADEGTVSATLVAAMSTGCFWVFALSISLFGMVSSGVSLFQQLILQERRSFGIGVSRRPGDWATCRHGCESRGRLAVEAIFDGNAAGHCHEPAGRLVGGAAAFAYSLAGISPGGGQRTCRRLHYGSILRSLGTRLRASASGAHPKRCPNDDSAGLCGWPTGGCLGAGIFWQLSARVVDARGCRRRPIHFFNDRQCSVC